MTRFVVPSQHAGQTAMHIAAFEGDEATLKYLLQCRASPYIQDKVSSSLSTRQYWLIEC